jgi:hypothetical protein
VIGGATAATPIPVVVAAPVDTPCVVLAAYDEVGVMEVGNNAGTMVELYLASVGLGGGYPWCAGFVHYCHRSCGEVMKPEREFAAAAKWASKNEVFHKGQLDMYEGDHLGHPFMRISEDGDIFTLYYAKLGRVGHVGIVVGESEDYLETIEGNTSSGGSREGDGVYRRKRLKRTIFSVNRWTRN